LYAIALGWPENGNILVKSLAKDSPDYKGRIKRVELVGYGKVPFTRTADGLSVDLPADAPRSIAPVLKIAK
jgi:alpha-L-fucosidase